MRKVRIGHRWIDDEAPTFIVAEAGSNHNGSFEQALRLIDVAAEAGADAVKFQLFRASRLYPKSAGLCDYLAIPKPIYEIIAQMEMPYDWLPRLSAHCNERGITFLSSVLDEEAVDHLDPYVDAFKIPSYEITHVPLIRHTATKGKPVILSTGTADLDEVAEAVEVFRQTGNDQLILLHCTGAYPAPPESLNIRAMGTLRETFDVLVGYSDHSRDPLVAPIASIAAGARVLEKHFTLGNALPGPDHRFALEPAELQLMVQKVREAERALGSPVKAPHPIEDELRRFARRSVFAIRDIAAREMFTPENIAVLRCGKLQPGLPPAEYPRVLGQHAAHLIRAESAIQADDVRP